jgi:hypothetical protein
MATVVLSQNWLVMDYEVLERTILSDVIEESIGRVQEIRDKLMSFERQNTVVAFHRSTVHELVQNHSMLLQSGTVRHASEQPVPVHAVEFI